MIAGEFVFEAGVAFTVGNGVESLGDIKEMGTAAAILSRFKAGQRTKVSSASFKD